jgi:hypothetical protein
MMRQEGGRWLGGERRRGGEGGEGGEKEARDPELLLMEWCKRPLKLTHAGAAATFMCALPPSRLGGAGKSYAHA